MTERAERWTIYICPECGAMSEPMNRGTIWAHSDGCPREDGGETDPVEVCRASYAADLERERDALLEGDDPSFCSDWWNDLSTEKKLEAMTAARNSASRHGAEAAGRANAAEQRLEEIAAGEEVGRSTPQEVSDG